MSKIKVSGYFSDDNLRRRVGVALLLPDFSEFPPQRQDGLHLKSGAMKLLIIRGMRLLFYAFLLLESEGASIMLKHTNADVC